MTRVLALIFALLAVGAPSARAATVGMGPDDTLFFGADAGEVNRVTAVLDGDAIRISDPGARTFVGVGCVAVPDEPAVTCPVAGVRRLWMDLGDGDDQLAVAVPLPNRLAGGDGADLILGGDGPDTIYGGPGSDTLLGGGGDDRLDGEDGNNVLHGGPGADRLIGGHDDDQLFGEEGDDAFLFGNDGDDLLDGGDGDDVLDGGNGPEPLVTDADRIIGGAGFDTLSYVLHADAVTVSLGNGPGDGMPGEGDDVGADIEHLVGSLNADALTGGPGPDVIDGSRGADVIDGGGGDDTLDGGTLDSSADTLRGGEGRDRLSGNAGDDLLDGGPAADVLAGGTGSDTLAGGPDADTLNGDDGDDQLEGGAGPDLLSGGPGTDTVRYAADAPVEVTLDGVANDGIVNPTPEGRTRVEEGGRSEGDNVDTTNERVDGSSVDDTVTGNADANTLTGAAGEDYLNGGGSSDVLSGGPRADTIMARDGHRDRVSCGSGSDYVIADTGDLIARASDCEYIDDGSTTRPTPLRDVTVDPRCGHGLDADLSPPGTRRSVPLGIRARVPLGSRVDSLDCEVLVTAAVAGGKTASGSLGRGSGAMAITQTRADGQLLTRMRTTDCPTRARVADARARVSRYPLPRYRRRYGRFAIPVEVRLDTALIRTRRGVASFEVDDRCGRSATVRVASGRLTVVELATDRRVVLGPGDTFTARRG